MRGVLCKYNSKKEQLIDHRTNVYCNKRKTWVPVYTCNKSCQYHTLIPTVSVTVPVGRCDECPYHYTRPTDGAGYAEDYFCRKANKEIAHYIEWESEIPTVPEWCPFREKEDEHFELETD